MLADLTATAKSKDRHFTERGKALEKIVKGRLYRAKYRTFEGFCQAELGCSRRRAYQLIEASKLIASLGLVQIAVAPSVVIPVREKEPIPAELRWAIWERDNFTCHYCGSRRNLAVDHKIPESEGGDMSPENLVTSCKSCNSRKGTKPYGAFVASLKKVPHE